MIWLVTAIALLSGFLAGWFWRAVVEENRRTVLGAQLLTLAEYPHGEEIRCAILRAHAERLLGGNP